MIIAEELDLPVDKVHVTLADARPELVFNQLTGGSNTTVSIYTPIRVAAAIAKGALLEAAAIELGVRGRTAEVQGRRDHRARRRARATYGELAAKAASRTTTGGDRRAQGSAASTRRSASRPTASTRRDIVTGQKKFAMDLDVPDALPTMVCRPPTHQRHARGASRNLAAVRGDARRHRRRAPIATGVAVRAATFGQCIDAVRALDVEWNAGHGRGRVRRRPS